jgi:hypothetical protein
MASLPTSFEAARQRRVALRDALGRLEDGLSGPAASGDWRAEVAAALSDLGSAFAAHVEAVEADEGLLAEITEDAPRLTAAAERLRRDHDDIPLQIEAVTKMLEAGESEAIREQAFELMRAVVRHRQRGSDIVYEAYATDIGGQGGS